MKKKRLCPDFPGNNKQTILRGVKLCVLFVIFMSFSASASVFAQQERVNLNLNNVKIKRLFEEIQQQTGLCFVFNSEQTSKLGSISITAQNETVADVLLKVLKNTNMTCDFDGNLIVVRPEQDTKQIKEIKITGRVTDAGKNPLPGATVRIKGTKMGVATDAEGNYTLTIPDVPNVILVFSFIGMKEMNIPYTGKNVIHAVLKESTEELEAVVVTGLFERKKEGFTGSANRVTGEEIRRLSSGNVLRALEMLDPGFRMNTSNMAGSNPSALPDFEMRGKTSMGNYQSDDEVILRGDVDSRPNQPLFVLDGIIGVSVTKILDIDPEQIASITLLKDAAAMVIYGAIASNGVIVVETKAPSAGRLRVSYNGNYKFQYPDLTAYNLLNASEKLELETRAEMYQEEGSAENAKIRMDSYNRRHLEVLSGVNTYWLSQPLQTAFTHRHGINLEGGDQALRYKIYFGLNQQPGIMKESGMSAKSASIDLRYRYKKIMISNQMFVDYTVSKRTSPYGDFQIYASMNPYYRARDENGNILKVLDYKYDVNGNKLTPSLTNPMYNAMYNQKDQNVDFSIRDVFHVDYMPIENLRLAADISISKSHSELDQFKPAQHTQFANSLVEERGEYRWSSGNTLDYNMNFTASYNKVLNTRHLISMYAGYTLSENNSHSAGAYAVGFPNDRMDEIFLASSFKSLSGRELTNRSFGFVGTANYSFDQRYAIDYSVRIDASSQFGRNNRFAPFWSTGLRWNLSKEKFISSLNFFEELVLRGTYGITGSQGFSPYQSLQMYTYDGMTSIYHSSDVIGAKLLSMGNPDLKWQKTKSWNFGVDFNIFRRILSGRFEYYKKYTYNTLLDFSLAPSIGFSTIPDNMGNISNRGYEISLRIMPYSNPEKRMNVSLLVNGGHNENRIEKISNALKTKNEEAMTKTTTRPLPRYEEGYSQTMIWAVRSIGIDPIMGREIFLTRDGERTYDWLAVDQVAVGDSEPKLRGSVGVNFNWAGLSINLSAQYRFGGQGYNKTLADKVENADLNLNVDRRALTDRWQTPGDNALFKGVTKDANFSPTKATTRFLMKDNQFNIATINLSYRFEQRDYKFMKNIGVSSAGLSLFFEDVARFETIKTERGISYPFARQISMSFNVSF